MRFEVNAAGGVVVRDGRVCLVHRPRYDDWTLPKGELDGREAFEAAALRAVWEETGLRCRVLDELEAAAYRDHKGREKLVRYWRMEVVRDEGFEPNDEVDEVRWVDPASAAALLTYEHDRRLVDAL